MARKRTRPANARCTISTPELDFLVEKANQIAGVEGARLTGAGWGGCMVVLVDANAVDALQTQLSADYEQAYGTAPAMFLCQAAPGAAYLGTVTS